MEHPYPNVIEIIDRFSEDIDLTIIYDIFRLSEIVSLGRSLKDLAEEVREERQPHKTCLSAVDGVSVNTILREIIDKEAYKEDYKNTTCSLLFTPVSYDTAISALEQLIEVNIFE